MVIESAVLAVAGGVLGIAAAHAGLSWLRASMEAMNAVLAETGVGWRVLLSAAAGSAVATLASGLPPALRASGGDLERVLREGSARTTGGRGASRLRWMLVTGEVFLSVALLVTAGLLARTLIALQAIEPGFAVERLVTARLTLPGSRYVRPEAAAALVERTLATVRTHPLVESASAGSRIPVAGSRFNPNRTVVIDGRPVEAEGGAFALDVSVAPDYFRTLGIPLVAGREFTDRDRAGAPLVVIVDRTFVRRYLGGGDAPGRRLRLGDEASAGAWRTIVGVAADVRNDDIDAPPVPHVYVPHAQRPERG
jgi:putative ABC transport system permease protein